MGKRGPKTTPIDWELVKRLSALQCTQDEIAYAIKLSVDSIYNRAPKEIGQKLSEYIKDNSMGGRISIRRLQFRNAEKGDTTMLIWLGKQYLGQTNNGVRDENALGETEADKREVEELASWLEGIDAIE